MPSITSIEIGTEVGERATEIATVGNEEIETERSIRTGTVGNVIDPEKGTD